MAEASCLTYETKVKGIDMIHLEELQDHVYEQLFIDDSTVFFLPYESTIRYDPKDTFLEQAFMGNCQAFDGYANEIGINGGLEGKPSPLLVACHCGHLSLVQHLCKKRDLVHEVSIKGMTPLFIAASEGHIHIMSWLLQNGADANEQESTGCHPLIVSAFQGRADMVKLLLKFGANANLVDKLGRTALMAAAQQGHTTVINILLQKGALVDLQAHSGSTAAVYAAMADEFDILRILHKFNPKIFSSYGSHGITLMSHICRHGNLDMVKAIQGLDHSLIHQVDDECRTPLMAATEGGHVKMVQYLVENGFSVNTTTDTGTQALTIAILEKNTAIIDILLPMVENVDVTDKYGNTVLLLASAIGDFKTVKSLIDSSADVNHQNLLGFTPLIAASKQGNIEIVKFLHGKNASITKTTKNGLTAQNMAYLYGHFDVSKFLESISQMSSSPHLQLFIAAHGDAIVMKQLWKDHIQDVIGDNIVNQYGVTSLMVASYFGNVEIVEFLLSSNVKVNVPNWHGFTAMEYAVANHKIYVADILAGHGLTFSPNKDGNYLIHAYIMSGCHDQVPDIIRLGSFVVNSKTNDGLTPLMIASQKGMFETVKYLVNHGAVLREKSKEGFTAQEYAFMNDNHSIAGYLKEVEIQQKERKESDNPAQSHFERMLLEFQLRQQLSAGMPAVLPSFSGSVSPFLQACMGDDQETAAKLHQEGYNVHVTDMEGENALTLACDRGSTRLAEWLIVECGLSPNSGNSNNFTALMIASRGGHFGCASLLLDHQAIINAKDVKTSKAALHIAVTNNHTDILELLLNHNAIIDIEDIEGFTPLSLACLRGSIGSVEILLNRGAKVNCRDHVGRTPAMNAARSGHMHILEVLVQHNANLEHITYHGKTASSYAMNRGHHEVVAWIESYLHDKSTKPVVEPKGTSELSIMSSSDSTEQLILSVGEKQNMEPIFCHIPGEEDCPLCFEGLIDNVVEGPASWTYNTILFTCVRKGNLLRLISLLDEGFDVNYQNTEGLTLLMLAASLGDVDTVTILLEHNADVNVKNYQGQDALMLALDAQHFDVAELLADKADTSGDDIVILKDWPEEDSNASKADNSPAGRVPTETTAVEDDESVKLYEKINEKWKQMFDECYKVVTTVMERDCPRDIRHVYRSWHESKFYVHVMCGRMDHAKTYFSQKVLHLLPCAKFIQVEYTEEDKNIGEVPMFRVKNPEEHFQRELMLGNGGHRMADKVHDEQVTEGQDDGSRLDIPDRELMDMEVTIQGISSPAKIVMTSIISQHQSGSSSSAAKPLFYTDTFAIQVDSYKGKMSNLNGYLVHLKDSGQPLGFILGHVQGLCLVKEGTDSSGVLLCLKVIPEVYEE